MNNFDPYSDSQRYVPTEKSPTNPYLASYLDGKNGLPPAPPIIVEKSVETVTVKEYGPLGWVIVCGFVLVLISGLIGYSIGSTSSNQASSTQTSTTQPTPSGTSTDFVTGYNDGYAAGKADGYNSGKSDGYNSGYTDGKNQALLDLYDFLVENSSGGAPCLKASSYYSNAYYFLIKKDKSGAITYECLSSQ